MKGWVWDGAPVAHTITGKTHLPAALLAAAAARGQVVAIPVPALTAGLAQVPDQYRPSGLAALLEVPSIVILPMPEHDAEPAADLLAPHLHLGHDIPAATVALHARRRGWPVLTDRPSVIRTLGAELVVHELP